MSYMSIYNYMHVPIVFNGQSCRHKQQQRCLNMPSKCIGQRSSVPSKCYHISSTSRCRTGSICFPALSRVFSLRLLISTGYICLKKGLAYKTNVLILMPSQLKQQSMNYFRIGDQLSLSFKYSDSPESKYYSSRTLLYCAVVLKTCSTHRSLKASYDDQQMAE